MSTRNPISGGFFLILPIVIGFFWGLTSGRALQGAIIGLVLGLGLALVIWAIDRVRSRR